MARVFLSHSSSDNREAVALKRWLVDAEPGLANEIFLDLDRNVGIRPGVRWKDALKQASERCEAVICLITSDWDASHECRAEFRTAEAMNKPIYAVRLEPLAGRDITSEWQRCDLFGDGPKTTIELGATLLPVEFLTEGLLRLRDALRAAGLAADTFAWPPRDDPDRSPYRGWQALETVDAAVYFGRDAQIGKALGELRTVRTSGENCLFVILGPSGVGKSSFLRAGLLPRLTRDTRHFLPMPIVRPGRHGITGDRGLARSIHSLRVEQGLREPSLGQIKDRIDDIDTVRGWLQEAQLAALKRDVGTPGGVPPTVVLPVDQGEELVGADAGDEGGRLLAIIGHLTTDDAAASTSTVVTLTIRSDRFEPLQTATALATTNTRVFDDLRPMPRVEFKEVICGPARRAADAGGRIEFAPELVDRLLADWSSGADTLPLLSLTLARLYSDYGDGRVGLDDYQAMGGMRGVVQTEVDELLSTDPDERRQQLDVLRSAFIPWLATINPDNDQPMRRVARWFDLPPESHFLLDEFVERRLLLKDDRDGEIIVEVALESLLRQWDALAGWLDVHAADLKDADALERAATAWHNNGSRAEWLLAGSRLAEAERLSAQTGFRDRLNSAREFLHASRQQEDQEAEEVRLRREAEILAARERQEAAEALAAAETRAKEKAQAFAGMLRRKTWILRAALAMALVVALMAVTLSGLLVNEQREKNQQYRQALTDRVNAWSGLLFDGQVSGQSDDALAMQLVLAAREIPDARVDDDALLNALIETGGLRRITRADNSLVSGATSPDGRRYVAGDLGGRIQQWDTTTLARIGEPIDTDEPLVLSVVFSPDGNRLVSVAGFGKIQLWNALDRSKIREADAGHVLSDAVFSPDGRKIVSVGLGGEIRVWNADTLEVQRDIAAPHRDAETLSVVAFAPQGSEFATGSETSVDFWDAETGERTRSISLHREVASITFSADGRVLAIGDIDGAITLWDTENQSSITATKACHSTPVTSLAFSSDSRRIASGGLDSAICLWDAGTGNVTGRLSGHETEVISVAFTQDDLELLSGSNDSTVRRWDANGGLVIATPEPVVDLAFSPDGQTLASSDRESEIRQWDSRTGLATRPVITVSGDPAGIGYSPDGRTLSTYQANRIQTWDSITGLEGEQGFDTRDPETRAFSYNEDRHLLAEVTENGIELWDASAWTRIGDPIAVESPVISIALSHKGNILAATSADGNVRLWDTETHDPVGHELEDYGWNTVLAFSHDDQLIAAGGLTMTTRVWGVRTGAPIGEPIHHDGIVNAMEFSPDGRMLAAAGDDGAVRFWDVSSGQPVGPALRGHAGPVSDVAFDADGSRLASASWDSTVHLWSVPTVDPSELCDKLTIGLSRVDWEATLGSEVPYATTCPAAQYGKRPNDW